MTLLLQAAETAKNPTSSIMIVVGIIVLIIVVFSMRKRGGPSGTDRTPETSTMNSRESMQVRRELDSILVRIQEVSREAIGRMDSKMRMLEQLIREADEATARLKQATLDANLNLIPAPPAAPAEEETPASPAESPAAPLNPLHQRVYELADEGKDIGEICRETELDRGEVQLILGLRGTTD
jgi:FtsZ-interacting cell division protein ZipA